MPSRVPKLWSHSRVGLEYTTGLNHYWISLISRNFLLVLLLPVLCGYCTTLENVEDGVTEATITWTSSQRSLQTRAFAFTGQCDPKLRSYETPNAMTMSVCLLRPVCTIMCTHLSNSRTKVTGDKATERQKVMERYKATERLAERAVPYGVDGGVQ